MLTNVELLLKSIKALIDYRHYKRRKSKHFDQSEFGKWSKERLQELSDLRIKYDRDNT